MPICLTLPCKKCTGKFFATFGEDEDPPELCEVCRGESSEPEVAHAQTIDSMGKLVSPSKKDLRY
jgi:hypothetical protein